MNRANDSASSGKAKLAGLMLFVAALGVSLWILAGDGSEISVEDRPRTDAGTQRPEAEPTQTSSRAELAPGASQNGDSGAHEADRPPKEVVPADSIPRASGTPEALVGLDVSTLDDGERERLKVPEIYKGGVKVTRVDPRSPAAEASIKSGDVIVQALMTRTTTPEELAGAVADREHTMIVVVRDGHAFNVTLHKPWRDPGK